MTKSKTTAMGILAIIAAIVGAISATIDGNEATIPDWTSVAAALVAGIGLIFARDNNKSSEDVGLK